MGLQKFDEVPAEFVNSFIFTEASKLDDLSAILARTEQYLREQNILFPAEDTLRIHAIFQREKARQFIYSSMAKQLTPGTIKTLDSLLISGDAKYSRLQKIKMPPLSPSVEGISRLTEKLDLIESTGVISLDLSWLNNNYQRITPALKSCYYFLANHMIIQLYNNQIFNAGVIPWQSMHNAILHFA